MHWPVSDHGTVCGGYCHRGNRSNVNLRGKFSDWPFWLYPVWFWNGRVKLFLLSQRNPIRKECLFIWVDLVPFWGLSANVGQGEGEGWKVKCSNLGMWRQREENVLSPTWSETKPSWFVEEKRTLVGITDTLWSAKYCFNVWFLSLLTQRHAWWNTDWH